MSFNPEPAIYIALTLVGANLLHALVHGLLAKALGIRLDEISVFYFGRSTHKLNNTTVRVGWIPMGAYVAPVGMIPPEGESEPTPAAAYEYRSRPFWQRALFSLSGVASLVFGVFFCVFLASPSHHFFQSLGEWLQQMHLFFEYLMWKRSPKDFTDILYNLGARKLLFYTGASWLSMLAAFAVLPTGVVGRAIWRFFSVYETKFGAFLTGLILVIITLAWVYMLLMMLLMVLKIYSMLYMLFFLATFILTSCTCALVVRWIVRKLGKNTIS
ncbi:MAG: hypothetical protein RI894_2485 [Bacteroidota bacterium]|jgi:hypothetical protein